MEENVIDETETNIEGNVSSVEDLEKAFQEFLFTYNKELGESFEIPMWFKDVMRTSGTRNITLETWNSLCANVRKLAANDNAVADLLENFKNLLKRAMVEIDSEIASATASAEDAKAHAKTAAEEANNAAEAAKTAAEEALDTKVTKVAADPDSNTYKIYCSHTSRKYVSAVSEPIIHNSLPIRDDNGTFLIGDPVDDYNPVNKHYADGRYITGALYNTATGVLQLHYGNYSTAVKIDLPVERILEDATLSDDGRTLHLNFRAAEGDKPKTVDVDIHKLVDRAWCDTVNDAEFPPTSKAVKDAINGEASIRKTSDDALGKRIDARIEAHNALSTRVDGLSTSIDNEITNREQAIANEASTRASDIRALNTRCSDLRADISDIQSILKWRDYEITPVEVGGVHEGYYQVGDALPRAEWVTKPPFSWSVSLCFDCSLATLQSGATATALSKNSLKFPKGAAYFLKIPVTIQQVSTESTLKVHCNGTNAQGEYISRYVFLDNSGAQIGNLVAIGTSTKIPAGVQVSHVLLYKTNTTSTLESDLIIENIRIYGETCAEDTNTTFCSGLSDDYAIELLPSAIMYVSDPIDQVSKHTFKYIQKLPKEGLV